MQFGKKCTFHCVTATVIVTTFCCFAFLNETRFRISWFFKISRFNSEENLNGNYSSDHKQSPGAAFRDLTAEFRQETELFTEFFDVSEALVSNGHVLTPVSAILETVDQENVSEEIGETNSTESSATPVLQIPNVVHYVFIGEGLTFSFVNYLSYRSVERFIKPVKIFVHGDRIPTGIWWNRTIDEVRNIYHVNAKYSKNAPSGKPYSHPAHISDYVRAEVLLRYGGIYMDADVMVVKSFTPLRKYPAVIGRQSEDGLCNGIMLAKRGAPFMRLLLEQYHSYAGAREAWAVKSVMNPHKLAQLYPHLVHVEETTLDRPSWDEAKLIYDVQYNWTQNYAVHLWVRVWPKTKQPNGINDVLTRKTTFGEIARLAMFGSHEPRRNENALN